METSSTLNLTLFVRVLGLTHSNHCCFALQCFSSYCWFACFYVLLLAATKLPPLWVSKISWLDLTRNVTHFIDEVSSARSCLKQLVMTYTICTLSSAQLQPINQTHCIFCVIPSVCWIEHVAQHCEILARPHADGEKWSVETTIKDVPRSECSRRKMSAFDKPFLTELLVWVKHFTAKTLIISPLSHSSHQNRRISIKHFNSLSSD